MPMQRFKTVSEQHTIQLGKRLGAVLKAGDVVLLRGRPGAGKTTFTRGIAAAFGYEAVSSPTFTLINEYSAAARLPIYHMDLYRLGNEADLDELGLDEYLYGNGICIIEWPELVDWMEKAIVVDIIYWGNDDREFAIDGLDVAIGEGL